MTRFLVGGLLLICLLPACEPVTDGRTPEPVPEAPPLPGPSIPGQRAVENSNTGWDTELWRQLYQGRAGVIDDASNETRKHHCSELFDRDNDGFVDQIITHELNEYGPYRSASSVPAAPMVLPELPPGEVRLLEPLREEVDEVDDDGDGEPEVEIYRVFDARGNQLTHEIRQLDMGATIARSYYVLDAMGNTLAEHKISGDGAIVGRSLRLYDCTE